MKEKANSEDWDPAVSGQAVRLRRNPGRQGITTGETRVSGDDLMVEVRFGPSEKKFKNYGSLELIKDEPAIDLLRKGRFGKPADLMRVLTLQKIRGKLTNVYYSMESSNTDFYPHQFRPVLKFIESPTGRLLIADEVGLGKTIESIYIWKELQARRDARRLLVICPAMLREKWRDDMKKRFNISAEIVRADHLLETLQEASHRSNFVYIVSLEGVRTPPKYKYEDPKNKGTRARLARLLDAHPASDDFALLDLVIFDEAHYLRNRNTANNRLGQLMRDVARHMILLTATPVQIDNENLYQLMHLIDPEEFYNLDLFHQRLEANKPVISAMRSLWRKPYDLATAREEIDRATSSPYFADDETLRRAGERVLGDGSDPEKRIEIARVLESRSLLGQYMVRSRKREVLEKRVERDAQMIKLDFSAAEQDAYDGFINRIGRRIGGASFGKQLALIGRQRQMESSLVAALESWREKDFLKDLLWEDLGYSEKLSGGADADGGPAKDILDESEEWMNGAIDIDIKALEDNDTKYEELKKTLDEHGHEKCVVFAFFRGTLQYLGRRLEQDGVRACLIMGGMGDEKDRILNEFRSEDGPSVLLSSEVGSEGIDLQFCRLLVNYDLPWNPMRIEQRIGRLDRLGQKAPRISIVNLAVRSTIADRILLRLYERIELFRESIGDLEDILGRLTGKLMEELLDPGLTEEDRRRRADEATDVIINQRKTQNELEGAAVNLFGFSDFILDQVAESREKKRWISGEELIDFVDDFFRRKYFGSRIEIPAKKGASAQIQLSDNARMDLRSFIEKTKPAIQTRLHARSKPLPCIFDPRQTGAFRRDVELIDPIHPLIQWIREDCEEKQLHPVSAIRLKVTENLKQVSPGDYVFVVHLWSFEGIRVEQLLSYRAVRIDGDAPLPGILSEALVTLAAREGRAFPNASAVIDDAGGITKKALLCEKAMDAAFNDRKLEFRDENRLRCSQQETSARKFADRRIDGFQEQMEKFRARGNTQQIRMREGSVRKEREDLQIKLNRVSERRETDETVQPLAMGVIRVEK
ncbi:MAG: SNF2-related protein [Alphaproteobacteria bacterium]|nr:SNF2-related protein [Alphaproteobacteria bacterium]